MIDHDVQMKLLELVGGCLGVASSAMLTSKYRAGLRSREVMLRAKCRRDERVAKANFLAEVAKRFNQDVQHLQVVTDSLSTKLVDCAVKCADAQAKLELALPQLRHLNEMGPRFASAVTALHKDLEAMRTRLREREIPGSGGKVAIEHPPQPQTKEKKP